jgi:hypothetical protein
MAFSFQSDFSLKFAGEEARDFIGDAVRTWPELFERVPGVTGTLLLSNSFALGGAFEYRWRVDIEKVSTLDALGAAFGSDDPAWSRLMSRWFSARTAVSARVMEHTAGDDGYAAGGEDALVHVVLGTNGGGKEATEATLRQARGVRAFQAQRTVLTAGPTVQESWVRLGGLGEIDDFAQSISASTVPSQLFQEVREIDGDILVGA